MTTTTYIIVLLLIALLFLMINYKNQRDKLKLDISLRDKIDDKLNIIRNTQQSNSDDIIDSVDTTGITGTILILDDQVSVVAVLTQLLKRHKFTVISFTSPQDAFEYLKLNKDTVDLIITDYSFPMMKGTDIIREFKSIKNIPLIVFTGYSYIAFDSEHERSLVDGVIYKPAQLDVILTKIVELLQKFRGSGGE